MKENQIHSTGGVTCPFLTAYCFDPTLRENVWKSNTQISCEDESRLLLHPDAEIVANEINEE